MNNNELLDDGQRKALERVRALFAEALPLLAAAEEALQVPEDERYVSRVWLEKAESPN